MQHKKKISDQAPIMPKEAQLFLMEVEAEKEVSVWAQREDKEWKYQMEWLAGGWVCKP